MNNRAELNKLVRHTYKYKQWRSAVFEKDDFTCQICGMKGAENLQADHYPNRLLILLSEYKITSLEQASNCKELWDINNGRLLCIQCHKNTPTYSGKEEGKTFEVGWKEKDTEDEDLEGPYFMVEIDRRFFTREDAEDFASTLKSDLGDALIGEVKINKLQNDRCEPIKITPSKSISR